MILVIKKKKKELFEFKLKILFYIVIALVYLKYLINVQTLWLYFAVIVLLGYNYCFFVLLFRCDVVSMLFQCCFNVVVVVVVVSKNNNNFIIKEEERIKYKVIISTIKV